LTDSSSVPWRYSTGGISVALRVTPRGGRDDIDGIETLANGRAVMKVRVRAIADGGEANKAVTELLARALRVPKASVRILSGDFAPQAGCGRWRSQIAWRCLAHADGQAL
jgi:uncharacterized protein YggU (UPF0235/DUF167 family)